MFKQPASLKAPFFLSSDAAKSIRPVTTALTCFGFNSAVVATALMTPDWLRGIPFAFMAFIAFIAGAMLMDRLLKQ